jgi:hypothetical protein
MSLDNFWDFPGPKKFTVEILDSIRKGNNLIISLPEKINFDLCHHIKVLIDNNNEFDLLDFQDMSKHKGKNPLSFISEKYSLNEIKNVNSIYNIDSFADGGQIILYNIDDDNLENWINFIKEYDQIIKNKEIYERLQFIILVEGVDIKKESNFICFDYLFFDRYITEADIIFFLNEKLGYPKDLLDKLKINLILNIAKWDINLANELSSLDLKDILSPIKYLHTYIEQYDNYKGKNLNFCYNNFYYYNYEPTEHIGVLISKNTKKVISNIIWESQIVILLPFLEKERFKMVGKYKDDIKLPIPRNSDRPAINSLNDIEISHILHQVESKITIIEKKYLNILKNMRNKLAHFNDIDYEMLKEFYQLKEAYDKII